MKLTLINTFRSLMMSILHHSLRFIWSLIISSIYTFIYIIKLIKSAKCREDYNNNKSKWDDINNIDDLVDYIKNTYKYKYDGKLGKLLGIFDHVNHPVEWFTNHGDCDDVAHYVKLKLEDIYGKDIELEYCSVHGFSDLFCEKPFWHYDVIYKFKNNGMYYLFNYGNMTAFPYLDDAGERMQELYKNTRKFSKYGVISWKCNW